VAVPAPRIGKFAGQSAGPVRKPSGKPARKPRNVLKPKVPALPPGLINR